MIWFLTQVTFSKWKQRMMLVLVISSLFLSQHYRHVSLHPVLSFDKFSVISFSQKLIWRALLLWCRYLLFYCISNALDRLSNHFGICVCLYAFVCVSVNILVVEWLHPQFFTNFHQILRAVQKFGWLNAYCFWDKPEVDNWF